MGFVAGLFTIDRSLHLRTWRADQRYLAVECVTTSMVVRHRRARGSPRQLTVFYPLEDIADSLCTVALQADERLAAEHGRLTGPFIPDHPKVVRFGNACESGHVKPTRLQEIIIAANRQVVRI